MPKECRTKSKCLKRVFPKSRLPTKLWTTRFMGKVPPIQMELQFQILNITITRLIHVLPKFGIAIA
jgi:hypothetical protein